MIYSPASGTLVDSEDGISRSAVAAARVPKSKTPAVGGGWLSGISTLYMQGPAQSLIR